MSIRKLDKLLESVSVAVAGASDRPGSVGSPVWRAVANRGFAGPVYPLSRRIEQLDGRGVFARPQDLPAAPAQPS